MNRKGFTLVELLAVIVILGVVMTIGSVSVTSVKRKIDQNMFENNLELIVASAKTWGNDNKQAVRDAGAVGVIKTIDNLIAINALSTDDVADNDNSYACSKTTDNTKAKCYVITNNLEGNVINNLTLKIYMSRDRVYACIETTAYNLELLHDTDKKLYEHLNYYCK